MESEWLENVSTREMDDSRMFDRRGNQRIEKALVHNRCGENEMDPAAEQLNLSERGNAC